MPLDAAATTRVATHHPDPRCYCNSPRSGWIVAVTHAQAEAWADCNLQRRGYHCFLPRYAAKRRDPVLHTLTRVVIAPLWPGYLFVHHDSRNSWRPIYETPGVRSVLKTRDQIQWANAGDVEALRATEDARRSITPPGALWAPGMPCSPVAGTPFAGHPAVIIEIHGSRAMIALMLFGQLTRVSIDVACLREQE
jgi:transcription antitermination factor NusG